MIFFLVLFSLCVYTQGLEYDDYSYWDDYWSKQNETIWSPPVFVTSDPNATTVATQPERIVRSMTTPRNDWIEKPFSTENDQRHASSASSTRVTKRPTKSSVLRLSTPPYVQRHSILLLRLTTPRPVQRSFKEHSRQTTQRRFLTPPILTTPSARQILPSLRRITLLPRYKTPSPLKAILCPRPTTPSVRQRQITASARQHPTTPSVPQRQIMPSLRQRSTTPSLRQCPTTPSKCQRTTTPSVRHDLSPRKTRLSSRRTILPPETVTPQTLSHLTDNFRKPTTSALTFSLPTALAIITQKMPNKKCATIAQAAMVSTTTVVLIILNLGSATFLCIKIRNQKLVRVTPKVSYTSNPEPTVNIVSTQPLQGSVHSLANSIPSELPPEPPCHQNSSPPPSHQNSSPSLSQQDSHRQHDSSPSPRHPIETDSPPRPERWRPLTRESFCSFYSFYVMDKTELKTLQDDEGYEVPNKTTDSLHLYEVCFPSIHHPICLSI